jgi:hypothetical protein
MKKTCENCQKPLAGRMDKKFCSTECKNHYNNSQRKSAKTETQEIDGYLHRNRDILKTIMGNASKETIDRLILVRAGFKFDYMTGIYFNKENKMYRILYDYAWMEFSDQKILIVKKALSKK